LREKHGVLQKHVAEQSRKMDRARDKVKAKSAESKGIKKSAEKPATRNKI
jgi:hypothetical protein